MKELEGINLVENVEDKVLWKSNSKKFFLVKSAYEFITSSYRFVENLFYKHLWDLFVPRNVNIFIWRLSVNRLPTLDNLLSRGVTLQQLGTSLCPFCKVYDDTLEHLFFTCTFASKVWNQCYSW
ncbi:putative ribonuclease H protein [Glycine soja]